jgi:integrase
MQRGQVFRRHGGWYLRFYEGQRRVTKRLGTAADFSKREAVELAQDTMRAVNRSTGSGVTLAGFIEDQYLPHTARLRASTHRGYLNLYRARIQGRPEAGLRLREYRTIDVQALLDAVAHEKKLASRTLQHIKHFLSGAFRYAAQAGIREGNPVRECSIPKRHKAAGETYAYNSDEISKILMVLSPLPRAAVACAAFAGLRLGEIQGLAWEDYTGDTLNVTRSTWRGNDSPTKSKASRNYVPVIPVLRAIRAEHRKITSGQQRMFSMDLINVGKRRIQPAVKKLGLQWHGWHAFRRGIASNLFALGCDDVTVQRVLRHSEVQVTREHYIKVRDAKLEDAMSRLSDSFGLQLGNKVTVSN